MPCKRWISTAPYVVPMAELPDICIGIVSGSNRQYTLDCLSSLYASFTGTLDAVVYVVDNASTPRLDSEVKQRFPQVQVIRNERRKGFGANHNAIMDSADARYFFLLNDDTIVHPGCCEALVAAADANPQAGFIGPKLLNRDSTIQTSVFKFPSPQKLFCEALLLHKFGIYDNYSRFAYSEPAFVDFLSGAALLVRRETVTEIGGLDEGFFMYAEETDWSLRGAKRDWKSLFVPSAQVVHFGGASSTNLLPERSVEFIRSHERLIRKHFGESGLLAYRLLTIAKHLPRLAAARLSSSAGAASAHAELDFVLWACGRLNRQGLSERAKDSDCDVKDAVVSL